jgi:hypothetical protein
MIKWGAQDAANIHLSVAVAEFQRKVLERYQDNMKNIAYIPIYG